MSFVETWRRQKSKAFDLFTNSTAKAVVRFDLWQRPVTVYANANLSIYSGQRCNAACPFCVEALRPAARGRSLAAQRAVESDDGRYVAALEECLQALRPLRPTLSVTGGEPSKDPRLPAILQVVAPCPARRKTLTTNGSGLLDRRGTARVIDHICQARLHHLNLSLAHPQRERNAGLMRLPEALKLDQLATVVRLAASAAVRVRLSCLLLRAGIDALPAIREYLAFARELGVDNVIFRQLMQTDPPTHAADRVVRHSDEQRVRLEPILDAVSADGRFAFVRQIVGYYYYVEVWRYAGMDVVFEEADLAQLEAVKRRDPTTTHELVFHPNAMLASTWQPWDGVLGPVGVDQFSENGSSRNEIPTGP